MTYQPSGSKLTYSTGTTIHEQQKWYVEARRDLQPARTIFYEQLIAQLIVWKHTDSNIILLGDFNENVYTGQIAKCLALLDLMLSKQCLQCTGMHVLPTFRDGAVPTDAIFATAGIKCINAYILPHKGGVGDPPVFHPQFYVIICYWFKIPQHCPLLYKEATLQI